MAAPLAEELERLLNPLPRAQEDPEDDPEDGEDKESAAIGRGWWRKCIYFTPLPRSGDRKGAALAEWAVCEGKSWTRGFLATRGP